MQRYNSNLKLWIDFRFGVPKIIFFFHTRDTAGPAPNKQTSFSLRAIVAAHLRGSWRVAPLAEEHTRLVVNKLKTQDWELHVQKLHYFSSIVYKWYVVVMYQTCAHIGNSCKRDVVVTYCSIICTSCKKHVSYTCKSGVLIQTGTEKLRNKRIFIHFPYCMFYLIIRRYF